MIIPILLLILSVIFLAGALNIRKLFLVPKKPSCTSAPTAQHQENSSPTPTSTLKKDDLKHVFDTFDKNKDGFITRQELKESLSNIGMYVTLKEVEEMVEKLDANKDGLIDVEEFRRIFELENTRATEVNGGKAFDTGKEECADGYEVDLKEAFDVFDGDKDGLITVKELGLVLSSLGLNEGRREEYCLEMIKKVDADGDGMVNFDEFKIMMRADSGPAIAF